MLDIVIADIMEVAGYLPIAILCGVVSVIVYFICGRIGKNREKDDMDRRTIAFFLLVVYMVVLMITVFFSREPGSRQGADFTIFGTWGVTSQEHAFVIENILLFIPFGILFPAVVNKKAGKYTVLLGFVISITIELIQLVTERGYCQLDDVVMNTVGTLIGYVLWSCLWRLIHLR